MARTIRRRERLLRGRTIGYTMLGSTLTACAEAQPTGPNEFAEPPVAPAPIPALLANLSPCRSGF